MAQVVRIEVQFPIKDAQSRETAHGEVTVFVARPCTCKGLALSAIWSSTRPGDSTSGTSTPHTLFEGEWSPGIHRFPFALDIPQHLQSPDDTEPTPIRWRVAASVAVQHSGGSLNVSQSIETPGKPSAATKPSGDLFFFKPKKHRPSWISFERLVIGGLVFAWLVLFIIFMLVFDSKKRIGIAVVMLLVLLVVPVSIALHKVKQRLIQQTLGTPIFTVSPDRVAPGGEVKVSLTIHPPKKITFNRVSAYLLCIESYKHTVLDPDSISGIPTTETRTRTLHRIPYAFALESRDLSAGQTLTLNQTLTIPPDAIINGDISWRVAASIQLSGCPDWDQERPITIL